jgi:hypothetical protein
MADPDVRAEYICARDEFRRAANRWHLLGEPQSPAELEALESARQRFIAAAQVLEGRASAASSPESQQISNISPHSSRSDRLAIRCLRPDLSDDFERDARDMTRISVQLGYAVDEELVVIDPSRQGPFTTVWLALQRTKADAVIVPSLEHVDGLEQSIRLKARIITVQGEKLLERDPTSIECETFNAEENEQPEPRP